MVRVNQHASRNVLAEQMVTFFLSAFRFPGLGWEFVLIAIGLALAFAVIWLLPYWPPLNRKRLLLTIGGTSAFLTWTAIAFIQIPLQSWSGQALLHFWNQFTLLNWLLLAGVPSVLISGLVQEGAKLVPTVLYWLANHRKLDLRTGLIAGALAGAGFGVFEAVWVHNSTFAAGFTWQTVQAHGFIALLGFVERFFAVGFHIAVSALAGYGLARGWGWRFYLIAAFLHGATNYGVVLMQKRLLGTTAVEIYIGAFAVATTAIALLLRWKLTPRQAQFNG